jgi:hypothetical protein
VSEQIDNSIYVCITHRTICPCDKGENHLLSNWYADVKKIKELMEKENGII